MGSTGILFVLSAPSGTGKSSVARRLLERLPGLRFSVSYTTRAARPGEHDGQDYHFVERPRFERMVAASEFLEWATVFGELYGTGLGRTREALAEGADLLLDIDVQGARQVRNGAIPAVSVMLLPPSHARLVEQLRNRASESAEQLERRLAQARREAEAYADFDYVVVNDRLDEAVAELESIVRAERRRTIRCAKEAQRIVASFPN